MNDLVQHASAVPVLAEEIARRAAYKWRQYFPDCLPGCQPLSTDPKDHVARVLGQMPTCRVLYGPHLAFFRAGVKHRERLFLAANRIGKSDAAAFEIRAHMTGLYPPWWEGRRFDHPTEWRVAGDTMLTTRDVPQKALMGPHEGVPTSTWTGMLDAHLIVDVTRKSGGIANCLDTVFVRHVTGGISKLGFLSYDMGRRVFQGFEASFWLDEEPPDSSERAEAEAQGSSDLWTECLMRTMTIDGMIMATFTPLRGLTQFLLSYLETSVMADTATGHEVESKSHFYPDALGSGSAPETGADA